MMMTYSWGTAVTQVMNVSSAALVEREEGGESVTLNDQHDSHNLTWYNTSQMIYHQGASLNEHALLI